jgi:hypothetical protein
MRTVNHSKFERSRGATRCTRARSPAQIWLNNDIAPLDDPAAITYRGMGPTSGVMPYAVDPESARRLRELSARLLKA